jgi:pimeloyl-ACP methyl ester carboxylesterase
LNYISQSSWVNQNYVKFGVFRAKNRFFMNFSGNRRITKLNYSTEQEETMPNRGPKLSVKRRSILAGSLAATAGLMLRARPAAAAVTVPFRKGYARGRFGLIHYRISQPTLANGRIPLLCFHMSPNSGRIYETFLRHVGVDRFALAPDTPGFGDSDPPTAPPSIGDYAAAMGDLIDSLGFKQVDLMGYHTGSQTCVELALQRPQQVRRLVLISTPIYTAAEGAEKKRQFTQEPLTQDGSHVAKKWRGHQRWGMEGRTLQHLAYQFPDSVRRPGISWWGHHAAFDYPCGERLAEVQQPVLVLNPNDDLHQKTLRGAEYINNGRIQELPDWGHGFLDLFPTQAVAVVQRHLDGEA